MCIKTHARPRSLGLLSQSAHAHIIRAGVDTRVPYEPKDSTAAAHGDSSQRPRASAETAYNTAEAQGAHRWEGDGSDEDAEGGLAAAAAAAAGSSDLPHGWVEMWSKVPNQPNARARARAHTHTHMHMHTHTPTHTHAKTHTDSESPVLQAHGELSGLMGQARARR